MGAQFSRFVIFCRFFVFLGDPSKIAVLPAWELNSVCIPPPNPSGNASGWVFGPAGLQDPPTRPQDTSKPRFWHHFGSILDRFWKDFWYNFGGVFYEKRCFTYMGAHFSKVSLYFVVSFLLAGISEIAVLPA